MFMLIQNTEWNLSKIKTSLVIKLRIEHDVQVQCSVLSLNDNKLYVENFLEKSQEDLYCKIFERDPLVLRLSECVESKENQGVKNSTLVTR